MLQTMSKSYPLTSYVSRIPNISMFYRTRGPKEEQNHEDYNMTSISYLVHRRPHGSFYGQAVRSRILSGTTKLRTSRIRAMWTAISSPLIHSLFKSTWLAF